MVVTNARQLVKTLRCGAHGEFGFVDSSQGTRYADGTWDEYLLYRCSVCGAELDVMEYADGTICVEVPSVE